MKVREAVSKLEKSREFKEFKKENPDHYLVHAFNMITNEKEDWQLGYYSKETDKVVVFKVGKKIRKAPEEEVLKKKDVVKPLELERVKLDTEGALKVAMEKKQKSHPGETVTKRIVILQNLEGKQVYNITLVTTNFNIINMKISAENGQVLEETKQSIMQLGKPMNTENNSA